MSKRRKISRDSYLSIWVPPEIVQQVFEFVPWTELPQLGLVCKSWHWMSKCSKIHPISRSFFGSGSIYMDLLNHIQHGDTNSIHYILSRSNWSERDLTDCLSSAVRQEQVQAFHCLIDHGAPVIDGILLTIFWRPNFDTFKNLAEHIPNPRDSWKRVWNKRLLAGSYPPNKLIEFEHKEDYVKDIMTGDQNDD